MKQKFTIAIVAIIGLTSCSSTRNLSYITDSEMMLSMRKLEKFDNNFLLYREGASGANGGKSGGGCGCN